MGRARLLFVFNPYTTFAIFFVLQIIDSTCICILLCVYLTINYQSIHNIQFTVAIQTYIAKLKSTISDLDTQIVQLKNDGGGDDDDDAHAHYHGHEKCTNDHGHGHNDHDAVVEEEAEVEKGCCDHGGEEGHSHEVSYK